MTCSAPSKTCPVGMISYRGWSNVPSVTSKSCAASDSKCSRTTASRASRRAVPVVVIGCSPGSAAGTVRDCGARYRQAAMTEADARAGPTVRVTAVQTGSIRIRPAHRAGRMDRPAWRRRLAILRDRDWTESLPIHTYLVEHPEGLFLFDAGETARTATRGFLPWWWPAWFEPDRISVDGPAVGPWPRSHPVTEDGRIVAVETARAHAGAPVADRLCGRHHVPAGRRRDLRPGAGAGGDRGRRAGGRGGRRAHAAHHQGVR